MPVTSTRANTQQPADHDPAGPTWRTLYRIGGAAALIVVLLTLAEVPAFMIFPQPETVSDWFALFQDTPLVGLIDFWGLEVPMYIMFTLAFLALYAALRRVDESLMAVALVFVLLGAGVFLATNNPFPVLSLSNQHAAAASDAERAALEAAGQALLINTNQRAVGGFNMGLFLVSIGGLIMSWVMLRGETFSRLTAYTGVAAFALSLADYLRQLLTQSELLALLVILPNALFVIIWFFLVGRRLYGLARQET